MSTLQEAADCVRQMPVLSIEPWIRGAVTIAVFVPGVLGFLMLNMAGDLPSHVDFTAARPVYTGDPIVAISLIYYVVIWVWIMEFIHAVSQFMVMFTASWPCLAPFSCACEAQVWYFRMKGRDDSFWSQFSAYAAWPLKGLASPSQRT